MQSLQRMFPVAAENPAVYRRLALALATAVVVLAVLHFALAGWNAVAANNNSANTDQGAYLRLSLKIRDGRNLTDGSRHPLFPLLLAPLASHDWSFFTNAKIANLLISIVGIVAIFALTRRRYGLVPAVAIGLLLSFSEEYLYVSSRVICESLLVLTFFVAWYAAVSGFRDWRWAWLGGAFTGLAYLTKANAESILYAFVVLSVLWWRRDVVRHKPVWAFVIAYLIVALPLFTYNVREYGDPLYNFRTRHTVWLDSWSDRYDEPGSDAPTLSSFLRTHSVQDIARREWQGVWDVRESLGDAILPFGWKWKDSLLDQPAFYLGLAALAGLLVVRPSGRRLLRRYYRQRREALWLTGLLFAVFYLAFAWYVPVAAAGRFLLPIAPPVLILLADFGFQLSGHVAGEVRRRLPARLNTTGAAVPALIALVVLAGTGAGVAAVWPPVTDVFARDEAAEGRGQKTMDWLLAHMDPAERVIRGPTHRLPSWQYSGVFRFKSVPSGTMSWFRMAEVMAELDATYFVVDPGLFGQRNQLLSQYFEPVDEGLRLRALPPGWELAYSEPEAPGNPPALPFTCVFCLLHTVKPPAGPPLALQPADFGGELRLLGYHLARPATRPGESLQVILYWQGLVPIKRDYAASVRLVDAAGRSYAQQEGLTVDGMFVTTGWPPGNVVADVRELAIGPQVPPGEYRLDVGVFEPATGERLAAIQSGGEIERVSIEGIRIE